MSKNHFSFQETKTDQGVPLYVAEMPHAPTVAVGVLIFAGTRDENWPEEAGLAHALEHMHLQGSKKFPSQKELGAHIENIGGSINAWTWKEMTFQYARVPASERERAIENLAERLRFPLIPENQIPKEMANIVQEIKRAYDNPADFTRRQASEFLYGKHPLGRDTLGTIEAVSTFTRDHFLSFIDRWYHPGNYVFIIAGQITTVEAKSLFEKHFPEMATRSRNDRTDTALTVNKEKELLIERDVKQANLVLITDIPGSAKSPKETRTLEFFSLALGDGLSSPLFQKVRTELGLCYQINAGVTPWRDAGNFAIYVGTEPTKVKQAIEAIEKVVEETRKDEKRFQITKEMAIGTIALETENTGQIISRAAIDTVFLGRPQGYQEIVQEIESLTLPEMTRVVDKYLEPKNWKRVITRPKS